MFTRRRVASLTVVSALVIAGAFALAAQSGKGPRVKALVYSAKFLCSPPGFETAPPIPQVEDGHYSTVINVHNPNADAVSVFKKAVSGGLGNEDAHAPGSFVRVDLQPDWAFSINCTDLKRHLPASDQIFPLNFDGFVVLISTDKNLPLDVTAVYTTQSRLGAPLSPQAPPNIEVVPIEPTETDTTPPTTG